MGGAAENVAEVRLENPVDPTLHVVAPYVEEGERDRVEEASCGLGANAADDSGVLPLSRMQLDRIEAAKARAAERAAAADANEPAPVDGSEAGAEGADGSEEDAVAADAPKMSDASQNETEADES